MEFPILTSFGQFGQTNSVFQNIWDNLNDADNWLSNWWQSDWLPGWWDTWGDGAVDPGDVPQNAAPPLLPNPFQAIEDTPVNLDLSDVDLSDIGQNRDVVTIQISADFGTLEADGNRRVTVEGSGTGVLELTGRLNQIRRFLNDDEAITYTGAPDAFGDGADTISMSATAANGTQIDMGSTAVDIEDVTDNIFGTSSGDTLEGDDGQNTIIGLEAADYLVGNAGVDIIEGNEGNDTIRGGADADTLDGGEDDDVLQYTDSASGVSIDLNADANGFQSASGGDADGDVISNFEHVYASDHGDTLEGDDIKNIFFGYDGDDVISGNGGDDVIRGGLGADTMDGGDGSDWLRFQGAAAGVSVDLTADENGFQSASEGEAEGDVISGFENIQGSDHGDTLTGDENENYLLGFSGDDVISGGDGKDTIRGGEGEDTLDGGEGADVLQYSGSSAGVTIDLNSDGAGLQSAFGGDAEGDVISNFEHVYATNLDDVLIGNEERNILYGYNGADRLSGGGDDDVLRGGGGADQFVFDSALGADNIDRIIDFETGLDTLQLDADVFLALSLGAIDSAAFHINDTGLAETAAHYLVYDVLTGTLYYDSDGTGAEDGVAFATLSGSVDIQHSDLFAF